MPISKLKAVQFDITKLPVEVIVNAANTSLLGGGGVDGAIHRAAGRRLYNQCLTLNGCETGQVKMTDSFDLLTQSNGKIQKIIHTVGPIIRGSIGKGVSVEQENLLKSCYVKDPPLEGV